jgi:hypothetical protein
LAVPFAFVAGCATQTDENENRVVAHVEKIGGKVKRDDQMPGKAVLEVDLTAVTTSDPRLRELVHLRELHTLNLPNATGLSELPPLKNLHTLSLPDHAVTDEVLQTLRKANLLHALIQAKAKGDLRPKTADDVHKLYLNSTKVTDAGLKELVALPNLDTLYLGNGKFTAQGLKEAALPNLRTLACYNRWPDSDLKFLADITSLQSVDLSHNLAMTEVGVKELARLPNLQSLNLNLTSLNDAGLRELAAAKKLQKLELLNTPVTDAGLKHLAGLQDLRWINLDGTNLTAAGLKELAPLKNLELVSVGNRQVTDETLQTLQQLRLLHTLSSLSAKDGKRPKNFQEVDEMNFYLSPITDVGLKELAECKNVRKLYLNETKVSDQALKVIANFKNLQFLDLKGSKVTHNERQKFQDSMPKCLIHGP